MSKGQIGIGTIISIGIAAVGFLVGSISYTNSKTDEINKVVSDVRTNVASVDARTDAQFQEIIRRLDTIDKKLNN